MDQPRSGAENMAVDDALLEFAAQRGVAVLRLYRWSEPTLSLGYFQGFGERSRHAESNALAFVRRGTGGGAIVHHHDWTYSVALPADHRVGALGAAQPLYDCLHDAAVRWLNGRGLSAKKWSPSVEDANCRTEGCSFLCFERRSSGDVVIGAHKVLGSAQRRHRGGLLQHGSLLLKQSDFAPSLLGLEDLSQPKTSFDQSDCRAYFHQLSQGLVDFLGSEPQQVNSLQALIRHEIHSGKYATEAWNHKR